MCFSRKISGCQYANQLLLFFAGECLRYSLVDAIAERIAVEKAPRPKIMVKASITFSYREYFKKKYFGAMLSFFSLIVHTFEIMKIAWFAPIPVQLYFLHQIEYGYHCNWSCHLGACI